MSIIPPLPKGVDPVREQSIIDWHRSARYMTLEEMCEALAVDYGRVIELCRADVVTEFKSDMAFDIELQKHLQRLKLAAQHDMDILKAYH